jgi:protein TonB
VNGDAISSVEPDLTEAARQAKVNINVLVKMVVDATGKPTDLHVDKPVGCGLEQKAIEAAAQYKFKPATEDGVAVPASVNVEVNFQSY